MKILLMEKFDGNGNSLGVVNSNGRDPRISFRSTRAGYTNNSSSGMVFQFLNYVRTDISTTSSYTNSLSLDIIDKELKDYLADKRFSISLNGLGMWRKSSSQSGSGSFSGVETIQFLGVTLYLENSTVIGDGEFPNNRLYAKENEIFNLEIVYDNGIVTFYKNNLPILSEVGSYTGGIFTISSPGWRNNNNHEIRTPVVYLKELVITELVTRSRLGDVRLDRQVIKSTKGTTLTTVEQTYTTTTPVVNDRESILATSIRTGGLATLQSNKLEARVTGKDGVEILSESIVLPDTVNRDSSCILLPNDSIIESDHSVEDLKLTLKAGEV